MPVNRTEDRVILTHPNGATAEVLLYGATVISWKSPSQAGADTKERLFVSSKSALDGTKPVRGGIPVVFPIFGPPVRPEHSKLAQHGFARSSVWQWDETVMDNEAGVSVRLRLEPTPAIQQVFPYPFSLSYVVTLAAHQLSTDIHVRNPSETEKLAFQALLHTYYAADAASVKVTPLKGLNYFDKVNSSEQAETRDTVDVLQFTDSVYHNAPGDYTIHSNEGTIHLKSRHFNDVVVWNPGQEAGGKIGDMETGGWERFVCVEPGSASYFIEVAPGEQWNGGQSLSVA